jgi:hypothetical protein
VFSGGTPSRAGQGTQTVDAGRKSRLALGLLARGDEEDRRCEQGEDQDRHEGDVVPGENPGGSLEEIDHENRNRHEMRIS